MFLGLCVSVVLIAVAGCARQGAQPNPSREPALPIEDSLHVKATTDSVREYRGEWESEFETSVFRRCDVKIPSSTWLGFAPGVRAQVPPRGNVIAPNTYYVRVLGILRGPADRRRFGAGY